MAKLKIDRIPVEMYRTVHKKDAYGNRIKDREKYMGYKKIRGIETGKRIAHAFVDGICFQIIFRSLAFIFGAIVLSGAANNPDIIAFGFFIGVFGFLLYPAYYFLFELFLQRTPGKYITQTLVVDQYNEKPDARTMALRTIIRLIPFESLSCFSDTNRGWHDRWSDTYVITKTEHEEITELLKKHQAA